MSSNKYLESAKSNEFFKGTDLSSFGFELDSKNIIEFKEGDVIFSSGMPSEFIYLLLKGEVKLKINSLKRLFFKSANEFFGESEVLQKKNRESSAIANNDCTVFKIDETSLQTLINNSSALRSILLVDDNVISFNTPAPNTSELNEERVPEEVLQLASEKVELNHYSDTPAYQSTVDYNSNGFSNLLSDQISESYNQKQYSFNDGNDDNHSENIKLEENINLMQSEQNPDMSFSTEFNPVNEESLDTPSGITADHSENILSDSNESVNPYLNPSEINQPSADSFEKHKRLADFLMQDVKAPLLTIKHYSSILSRFNLSDEVQKVINLIAYQSSSVIDILQASIDYSDNKIKPKPEEINLNESLSIYLTNLSDYVESRNVKLFKKLGEDAKIVADKRKLYVVFYYVSRFACDLMKNGGNLYYSTELNDNYAVICIKDENKYLNDANAQLVFTPDFSTDDHSNSGLSMLIAKFLIESMQGSLKLSATESGTIYKVSIPVRKL